jgi:hypothetical protein
MAVASSWLGPRNGPQEVRVQRRVVRVFADAFYLGGILRAPSMRIVSPLM